MQWAIVVQFLIQLIYHYISANERDVQIHHSDSLDECIDLAVYNTRTLAYYRKLCYKYITKVRIRKQLGGTVLKCVLKISFKRHWRQTWRDASGGATFVRKWDLRAEEEG